ncbi:class I SAM-dependent methyltransferase [Nitratireductor aquimarinus]|uniref:class I SAM-dependent methyltransferase n=1 Tax=Nitratireductor aquimarinus TaxID=889300 RepID=UPI001A8D35CF|nr:class I SAM-dependent methyltransferase [Nitratireductor aquimarinus]MBN8243386.1 class I SAM-dependent methyltransferase [Nitratireductor aquimarinus]MBY6131288.1 class I SAM-dependent methyltransferase [Nitratireductor aquimarinus]MCA1301956.1 class I SAM-dependent methyltransferase [Nitratireductor aquimarinus]
MTDTPLPTLLFPFERGLIDPPGEGERVLFLGAPGGLLLPSDFSGSLTAIQGYRPDYLALSQAGVTVEPEPVGEGYDMALVLLGRHRRENEQRLAEALNRTRAGALIIAACAKKDGGGSVRKRMASLVELEDHASKHHGVVFWLRRPERLEPALMAELSAGDSEADGFATAAGGFSDDGIDPGSALLVECLPDNLSGAIADFAAGWGYLSVAAAERAPEVKSIDLYEAHHASLEAARRNMAARVPQMPARFFWQDLLGEPVNERYDVILMNPPFHRSRAAEPDMGHAMIAAAAKALKPRGRLFLVANRQLPYEESLQKHFAAQGELRRDTVFKVLWARK